MAIIPMLWRIPKNAQLFEKLKTMGIKNNDLHLFYAYGIIGLLMA